MTLTPHGPRRMTGSSAASLILDLAGRDTIDPLEAARLLDLPVLRDEQVTRYRREYQLGTNALWADATAVVGGERGSWRIIDLVPRELSMAALAASPYEIRPSLKHTNDGPVVVALEHHIAVRAGTLIVRTRAESLRVERVTLTTRDG